MVCYFAKEDGFKWWEMPNTYCRRDAAIEAIIMECPRLEQLEEDYEERKQKAA